MNRKSQNAQKIKEIVVCGGSCGDVRIYKKASRNERVKQAIKQKKIQQEVWENRFDETEKQTYKYGVFAKRGYVMKKGFATEQQAQRYLESLGKYKVCYEVRKLEW